MSNRPHYIYLLYQSDIGQAKDKVYKYGRTISPETRFMGYPKNSTLLYICRVKDCYYVEDEIDYMFPKHFTKRSEYGFEYFETSDVRYMIEKIDELIDRLDQRETDTEIVEKVKTIYKRRLRFKIHQPNEMPENFSDELIEDYDGDDGDYSSYDRMKRKKKIMDCKKIRKILKDSENLEEMKLNVLYNKEKNLSEDEKKVLCLFKKRAEFLGVDYNKKVQKKHFKDIIINDNDFKTYYMLKLLLNDDMMNNDNIIEEMKYDYGIIKPRILITKLKLIKELEKMIDIKLFDIDTKKDFDRFNEIIDIADDLKTRIIQVFRVTKTTSKNILKEFKYWYYQLIHMYKNAIDNNLFVSSRVQKNTILFYLYSIKPKYIELKRTICNI